MLTINKGYMFKCYKTPGWQLTSVYPQSILCLVLCCVSDPLETPWTEAHQAPLSKKFSRQEYWSGLPFLSPGVLTDPRNQTRVSYTAGRFFTI